MKKVLKNIIMIFIIVILLGVNYLVMNRIKDDYYNKVRTNAFEEESKINEKEEKEKTSDEKNVDTIYYLVFVSLDGAIAFIGTYVVLSKFNSRDFNRFISKPKRVATCLLIGTGLTIIFVLVNAIITREYFMVASSNTIKINKKKEVKFELDMSNVINNKKIDLSSMSSNVTIEKSGDYVFTGNFDNAIIVNAEGEVSLTFKDVIINGTETAAIIGLNADLITIKTESDTINSFSDFGETEYNGVIYSKVPLAFAGDGVLKLNGKNLDGAGISCNDVTFESGTVVIESQNKGIKSESSVNINDGGLYIKANSDGISSDKLIIDGGITYVMATKKYGAVNTRDDFIINGGTFIGTGYKELILPSSKSKQKVMCFNLDEEVLWGTKVGIKTVKDELILSFKAESDFKNLIISDSKINTGKYNLYVDGENTGILDKGIYYGGKYISGKKIEIDSSDVFEVNNTITVIGIPKEEQNIKKNNI